MADNYTVTAQKQDEVINPQGNGFEHVWEITYKVTDGPSRGTSGMVRVSEDNHNAEYVRALIESKIAALDEVANL